MTDYIYTNGKFSNKDTLPTGNAAKKIVGSDFEAEFVAIEEAVNSKLNSASPVVTGDMDLNGSLDVSTNIVVGGTLGVTGATTLTSSRSGTSWIGKSDGTIGVSLYESGGVATVKGAAFASLGVTATPITVAGTTATLNATTGAITLSAATSVNSTATINAPIGWFGNSAGTLGAFIRHTDLGFGFIGGSTKAAAAAGTINVGLVVQGTSLIVQSTSGAVQVTADTGALITANGGNVELTSTFGSIVLTHNSVLQLKNAADQVRLQISTNLTFPNLPTSAAGLTAGMVWRNGNVLNIV